MAGEIGHQRWRTFYNAGESDVPAFGALEVTGMTLRTFMGSTHPVVTAKRPTSASLPGAAVNSHLVVPIGCYGELTFDFPTWALYDDADTPTYGESWGTQANSYELGSGNTGFTIIGGQTLGRVYVERVSSSTTAKTIYLPLQDQTNYLLPQLGNTAYGYEWSISATKLDNLDTGTALTLKDYYGSIALPGQKLYCTFSSTLNAWTPIPYGQNALQLVRVYKNIAAYTTTSGNDIWFVGYDSSLIHGDLFEASELVNDEFDYGWGSSDIDIEASPGSPVECYAYLFHEGGGCEWRIIGRACNPQQ